MTPSHARDHADAAPDATGATTAAPDDATEQPDDTPSYIDPDEVIAEFNALTDQPSLARLRRVAVRAGLSKMPTEQLQHMYHCCSALGLPRDEALATFRQGADDGQAHASHPQLAVALVRCADWLCVSDLSDLRHVVEPLAVLCELDPVLGERYIGLVLKAKPDVGRAALKSAIKRARPAVKERLAFLAPPKDPPMRGQVFPTSHGYVDDLGDKGVLISTFIATPLARLRLESGEAYVVDISCPSTRRTYNGVVLCQRDLESKHSLTRRLPFDARWMGTDDQVQGLAHCLSVQDVPDHHGTEVVGYHETDEGARWVTADMTIGPLGPISKPDIVYVRNQSPLEGRVRYVERHYDEAVALVRIALPLLLEAHSPAVTLALAGWFFAAPLKELVTKALGHFPILMVWGTQGAGKTSIVQQVYWRLAGVDDEPFGAGDTEFAQLRLLASTNGVPVVLDEYKPSDMAANVVDRLHRLLRRAYCGEVILRGRADQTVVRYRLAAPICVIGESRPTDAAVVDRLVVASPDSNALDQHPEYVEAFNTLRSLELRAIAPLYLEFLLGRDFGADLADAATFLEAALDRVEGSARLTPRSRDNLKVVALGLVMMRRFAERHGAHLPELDLAAVVAATLSNLMDGSRGGRNALDDFIETVATMGATGMLEHGKHILVKPGRLFIRLQMCWGVYLAYLRTTGQRALVSRLGDLRRMLEENHARYCALDSRAYVASPSTNIDLDGGRPRVVAIDTDAARRVLEIDDLPDVTGDAHETSAVAF